MNRQFHSSSSLIRSASAVSAIMATALALALIDGLARQDTGLDQVAGNWRGGDPAALLTALADPPQGTAGEIARSAAYRSTPGTPNALASGRERQ